MTQQIITGWDIGGAHLKVAQCTQQGELLQAFELPCPLWQGIDQLHQAMLKAKARIQDSQRHAITMTGELVDIFPDRRSGVTGILNCVQQLLPAQNCAIYAAEQQWLSLAEAKTQWQQVASRNWQASATLAAQQIKQGLLVDVGSTTSDIIAIQNYQALPDAFNDFDRQANCELHYAGVIRTPLIAIAQEVPFADKTIRLAAEVFATSGDFWCLLGQLDPLTIQDVAADQQSWQKADCMRRLARLLGTDADAFSEQQWLQLAQWFANQQAMQLQNACQTVLDRHSSIAVDAPLVGAGIGRFMVQHCAKQMNRDYVDFSSLTTPKTKQAADHAPCVAIALLASQQLS